MTVPTNSANTANTANTAITDLHKQDTQFLLNNYGRINMHFVKGSGARLWDNNGNEYLDFVSGIAVNAFGHAPQMVQNAIQEQMQNLFIEQLVPFAIPGGFGGIAGAKQLV
jgi:acetylornithine/succinyldiaminopimelate/putrescine aminotransferase